MCGANAWELTTLVQQINRNSYRNGSKSYKCIQEAKLGSVGSDIAVKEIILLWRLSDDNDEDDSGLRHPGVRNCLKFNWVELKRKITQRISHV